MKRRFTILTAALALLTFLAVPMGMRGQTRTNQTAFYGFETGDAGWTATTFVTNNTAITAHGGSKYGATNGTTASVQYNDIVASPQSLTCYYSKTTTNTNAGSKFHIQVSSNNSTWTTVESGLGMDQVTKGTWYELTADLSSYSNVYVRVRYDGTTGVRALDDITLIYDDGNTPSTDPEITFTPASITVGEVLVGNEVSTTFSVSQANLTSDITLSVDNGSLSTSSIAQGAAATNVTWTYTPTTAGAITATVTATSGTTTETLAISGTAIAPVEGYDVNFEYATDMYPNWTFDNMTSYQTGSITAHGGTYYGTTGGKATASITTSSTVANPGTLTCYVSKQSGNTTSSTWYIQVSEDGSDWTDVESHSATSMSQGSWVEFTADLTDYTDVYVRVYYSGSTAIRNIDDLTLTTVEPSSAVATTTTINLPQNFNTDIYQGTTAGTLTATVSAEGAPISGATVTWSSSNTGVATIDANGEVTLVAVGTTTITASYAGVEDEYRPSTGTYELTVTDSNAPGTQNNPYTVAQAIAATPSSGNVYIQGIVSSFYSTSIVDDGSNYRYYISDDGTTTTELLVYRGTGLNQAPFTNADDLLVGDEVVICGTLTMYHDAPEINSGNYLYSWNRPSITEPSVTVIPNTINAPFAGAEGTLALTYENIEEFISFDYYFCDAEGEALSEDPDWIYAEINEENDTYSLDYLIDANDGAARTAYIKVYTFDDELEEVSSLVTITQAAYEDSHYTWDLSIASYESASTAQVKWTSNFATMVVDKANAGTNANNYLGGNQTSTRFYKNSVLTITPMEGYAISSVVFNATTTGYASALQGSTWTNATATIDGTIVTITPTDGATAISAVIGNTCGFTAVNVYYVENNAPSITVTPDEVNVDATSDDEDYFVGTLDLTWENLEITDFFEDFAIQYYDAEGEEVVDPDWIIVDLATQDPNIGEGYLVSYMIEENEGTEARTAYFKVFALGDEDYVYSNLVTISQAAPVAPATGDEYALYTGALVEGDYLIVYDGGAMNTTVESDRLQYEDVTVNNDVIVTDNAAIVWHIAPSGQYWTIYNVDAGEYAASTGAKNKAQMLADGTDDKALWTVSGTETYEFVNKKNTDNSVNANLRKNGTYGFACYATSTGGALSLYKKVAPTETHTLTVDAYTDDNIKDGYNLIASPVNVDPATVAGMTTGDFDLYSFDESQADEWRNYEATAFNLVPGKGYLYAKKATTENQTYTFQLTGIPYNNEPIILSKSESGDFPGWNLVGNPFGETAVLSDNRDFYVMNSDGSDFIQGSGDIAPMQGIFVIADQNEDELVFTPVGSIGTGPIEDFKLVLNLTKGRGIIDRAVVRFGEGRTLPKFMLNANNTKLYITEGNQDYAVVRSNNAGEMPVSFKAAENGNYTLSIETENVEVSYLHLIDNMTGADVDLLATPSYSFDARTTDNANRFRLMFNTNGVDENTTTANFAYFNGSSWTISNMGEATLQVVDMMGRVISTQAISGNTDVNLNQAAGVYMLRLVNGENVMVQKVVVR